MATKTKTKRPQKRTLKWVRFMDMHSGGGSKEKWEKILIEAADEQAAKVIFYNRFGHNPERVTCTCCGQDYSIGESDTIEEATAFDRGCAYDREAKRYVERGGDGAFGKYQPLDEYLARKDVLVIRDADIKEEERTGDVPQQGYVWRS